MKIRKKNVKAIRKSKIQTLKMYHVKGGRKRVSNTIVDDLNGLIR